MARRTGLCKSGQQSPTLSEAAAFLWRPFHYILIHDPVLLEETAELLNRRLDLGLRVSSP